MCCMPDPSVHFGIYSFQHPEESEVWEGGTCPQLEQMGPQIKSRPVELQLHTDNTLTNWGKIWFTDTTSSTPI